MEKSSGPRTDHWGTQTELEVTADVSDEYAPMRTDCLALEIGLNP